MIEPTVRKRVLENDGPDLVLTMPVAGSRILPAFWALYGVLFAVLFPALAFGDTNGPPLPFALFMLAFGLAFATFGAYGLFGRERVRISSGSIAITRGVLGVPVSTRDYPLAGMTDLRYTPEVYAAGKMRGSWVAALGSRRIGFESGGRTVRFAAAIDEAEARAIIRDIKKRFPVPGVPE